MSRRPQEPPRSVSRHHRMTFLKASGIVGQLFKARRPCQKIRCAHGIVATNQEFTNSPFCAAVLLRAFTHKDSQSRAWALFAVTLCCSQRRAHAGGSTATTSTS